MANWGGWTESWNAWTSESGLDFLLWEAKHGQQQTQMWIWHRWIIRACITNIYTKHLHRWLSRTCSCAVNSQLNEQSPAPKALPGNNSRALREYNTIAVPLRRGATDKKFLIQVLYRTEVTKWPCGRENFKTTKEYSIRYPARLADDETPLQNSFDEIAQHRSYAP